MLGKAIDLWRDEGGGGEAGGGSKGGTSCLAFFQVFSKCASESKRCYQARDVIEKHVGEAGCHGGGGCGWGRRFMMLVGGGGGCGWERLNLRSKTQGKAEEQF